MGTIYIHQHTDAEALAALRRGASRIRAFAKAAEAFAAEAKGTPEAKDASAIAEALIEDSPMLRTTLPHRHLVPKGTRAILREVAEIHGEAVAAAMRESGMCPVLLAEGISAHQQYADSARNLKQDAESRTNNRCPVCTASDVVRTLRRDGAEARDAELRWNRKR